MKLRTLKPSIRSLTPSKSRVGGSADIRAPESVRTKRRLKLWTQDPHCQHCRALVDYPWGFELDHIIPLSQGGPDTEENSQVLCVWYDEEGKKQGCHVEKTKAENSGERWNG